MKKLIFILCAAGMLSACTRTDQAPMQVNNPDAPCGMQQAQALWTATDGSQADFEQLAQEYTCATDSERVALYESLGRILENCFQSADMLTVELLRPTQLTNAAEPQTPDWIMSGYSPLAHFSDDMFANQLAFITILNFPHYTLDQKNRLGADWNR